VIWLGLALMISSIIFAAASLRDRRGDALGVPLVAIGSFAFLYVIQPIQVIRTDTASLFLSDWQVSKGLMVPALMLLCFMWGWTHPGKPRPRPNVSWDPRPLWKAGFSAACAGMALYLVFLARSGGITAAFSQAHGAGMAYDQNTAYIYEGPWLILSGAVMMFLGAPHSKRDRWKMLAPHAFLSLYFLAAILTGSRAGFFAGVTTYFIGTSIAQRKRVTFRQAGPVLLLAGIGVFSMLAYRSVLHLGSQQPEAPPSIEKSFNDITSTSEYDQEHDTTAQEFLIHAAMLDTVDQTGKLGYGLTWITFLVINPIPRLLWPEKTYPEGLGVSQVDIKEQTSLLTAPGSAPGLVADLYSNFHLFSTLFFVGLGCGLRRLFIAARNLNSPVAAVGYVMFYAVSLNMFAQGFITIAVPICYSMAPVILLAWTARRTRRRTVLQRREMLLLHAATMRGGQWSS
jgi:hypothetical protein